MKKSEIFILLFCMIFIMASCSPQSEKKQEMTEKIENKATKDESLNFEELSFDSNGGIIFPLLNEDGNGKIKSRNIIIDDGEENYSILTDTFEIEKGGTFYYPYIPETIEPSFLAESDIPFEIVIGEKTDNNIEKMKASISNYDFEELSYKNDKKVTFLEFTNEVGAEDLDGNAPSMAVYFPKKYIDNVFSVGFEGQSFNDDKLIYSHFIENNNMLDKQKTLLIFNGEAPSDFTVKGFKNGSLDEKIDGLKVEVETKEILLHELLIGLFKEIRPYEKTFLDKEYYKKRLQLISDTIDAFHVKREEDDWNTRLEDYLVKDIVSHRFIYLKFEAKDTSTIKIKRLILPSSNHYTQNSSRNDMSEFYVMKSNIDSNITLNKDVKILGALSNKGKNQNEEKTTFNIPKNNDFRLVFSYNK